MKFGLTMFATDYSISVVELGRAAEEYGFDSLWLPEHTHMPLNHSPWAGGPELPREYSHSLDPFVALGAVAAVTSRLLLGTGVCLVIQRDPLTLAKEVATLDLLSGGRVLLGIGAGWNRPEIENHGVKPTLRWRVMRERVLAMKELWTKDVAEYHGQFVDFGPAWSWPKPVQKPHPPIIMGGDGEFAERALLEYCDEWLPRPGRGDRPLGERLVEMNRKAAEAGRGAIPISIFSSSSVNSSIDPAEIESFAQAGVQRCILRVPPAGADEVLPLLKRHAEIIKRFS